MSTALVTGASGLVGRFVCEALLARGYRVRACVHRAPPVGIAGVDTVRVGEVGPQTDWSAALAGADSVVHLAARAHVMRDRATDPLAEFRQVNARGTEALARQAATAGVRRLVLVSTVKVNGEATSATPFRETDPPAPRDPYAVSKWEAEAALWRVCAETALEGVVVRPVLVYGPGVRGNLRRLLRALQAGWPLPFGAVDNRRSLVGVWNLADLLAATVDHPAAGGETFLVADGEDLSTPELVRGLAAGLGRPARLLPVPVWLLRGLARLLGYAEEMERLCGSLAVDAGKARRTLGWTPPVGVQDGLIRTARWYREAGRGA
jgi:nucleoside-diphosphate-sugar epimerase